MTAPAARSGDSFFAAAELSPPPPMAQPLASAAGRAAGAAAESAPPSEAADTAPKAKHVNVIGPRKQSGKPGGLGIKKLSAPVDAKLGEQKPSEGPVAPVGLAAAAGASSAAAHAISPTGGGSSRFAYNEESAGGKRGLSSGVHDAPPSMGGGDFFETNGGLRRGPSGGALGSARGGAPAAVPVDNTAQRKFGNAKSISSDSFNDQREEAVADRSQRLSRFQGQSAISSADFFSGEQGDGDDGDLGDLSPAELLSRMSLQAKSDMANLKGIAASASRILSGMANSVLQELQER